MKMKTLIFGQTSLHKRIDDLFCSEVTDTGVGLHLEYCGLEPEFVLLRM